MPFGIGRKPDPVSSGNILLQGKNNVEPDKVKRDFNSTVNNVLADVEKKGNLTKADYKVLKDSMVEGRQSLNVVLEKAGVLDVPNLEKLFAKNKNNGAVSITPLQKDMIKSMLTGQGVGPFINTNLNQGEQAAVDHLKNTIFSPVNRDTERYSLRDFVFSPEVSGVFKEHLSKQTSSEHMDFLVDVNNTLKNPTEDKLDKLYEKYLRPNAYFSVNIPGAMRDLTVHAFNTGTLEDKIRALEDPSKEALSVMKRDSFNRFVGADKGIGKAILKEAMTLPSINARENFIKQFSGSDDMAIKQGVQDAYQLTADQINKNIDDMG
jgi:hypothetical protein